MGRPTRLHQPVRRIHAIESQGRCKNTAVMMRQSSIIVEHQNDRMRNGRRWFGEIEEGELSMLQSEKLPPYQKRRNLQFGGKQESLTHV
jgi:hypothetical protein